MAPAASRWADALQAAALFALAGPALGGVVLRCSAGPVRERWIAALKALLPAPRPWRPLPSQVGDERLLGGLDLAATLRTGRPVVQRGVLAEADGGVVVLPMAERWSAAACARLTLVMDAGEVQVVRDGVSLRQPSRFGVLALDEGIDADERLPAALAERLAFHVDLTELSWRDAEVDAARRCEAADIARVGARMTEVQIDDAVIPALCAVAQALGIGSARAPCFALLAARACAALAGRTRVAQEDVETAARLVLAPRATCVPAPAESADGASREERPAEREAQAVPPEDPPAGEEPAQASGDTETEAPEAAVSTEQLIAAARSAIGAGLLARLQADATRPGSARSPGRSGATGASTLRGRPAGVQRGEVRRGARLNLIETLRAAAPWQLLRRGDAPAQRIAVRPEDFRVTRFKQRRRTTTVFAIDASGSSALHRLAEAKGAVELLLAECYVRRDEVAVLAFRGAGAELLLPATRSLVRAKRSLAGLPGGGGTPLAAGLDAAFVLADGARRRGDTPLVVFLTDGRANIARDGTPDRVRAEQDALQAATRWRGAGFRTLLIDTSARPDPRARALAERMQATYLPLPYAQAATLSQAVRRAAAPGSM